MGRGNTVSLDDQVSEWVAIRDAGDVAAAAVGLEALVASDPSHFRATLELLVVTTTFSVSDVPDRILAGMPESLQAHPHIRLLMAHHHRQNGRLSEAMTWLRGVPQEAVAGVPSFARLRKDLLAALASHSVDLASPFIDLLPSQQMHAARLMVAETLLQDLIASIDAPDDLFIHLQEWTFLRPDALHLRADVFARLLSHLPENAPTTILSTALAYMVATRRWDEARQMVDRLLRKPDAASDAVFVKAFLNFADEGDPAYAQTAARMMVDHCSVTAPDDSARKLRTAAVLNALEVKARKLRLDLQPPEAFAALGSLAPTYAAQAAPVGRHLYVGLFGQVRFGKYLLAPLADYLQQQFSAFVESGGSLSFGIATWKDSGQRELQEQDGYSFLRDLLPVPIMDRLASHRLMQVRDAAAYIPTITRKLIDEGRETQSLDAATLQGQFIADALVSIEEDERYMGELGERLKEVFGNSIPVLNQGRMWNRISAHRALVAEAEQRAARPVTHALLIRSDLTNLAGPLGNLVDAQIRSGETNWGMFDHDPHATYIEGVGDRYMVVDRAAFERLMDGYQLLQSIVAPNTPVNAAYRVRLFPHTHLRTILFEHATKIREILRSSVEFEIYRGRRTVEQMRAEIEEDARRTTVAGMAEFLNSLV